MNRPRGFHRRTSWRSFGDRREAGRVLAEELTAYRGTGDVLVLGLARGGVPVAWEVARALQAPLDVFLVRKLGVPQWPELAMGALATGGRVVMNDNVIADLRITDDEVQAVIAQETAELRRREETYRGGLPPADPGGRTVILVDDGIATGASMGVAVLAVRAAAPDQVVVAVPVGPNAVFEQFGQQADDVVCATTPPSFQAVGQAYHDFHQVSDDEVRTLLTTPTVG